MNLHEHFITAVFMQMKRACTVLIELDQFIAFQWKVFVDEKLLCGWFGRCGKLLFCCHQENLVLVSILATKVSSVSFLQPSKWKVADDNSCLKLSCNSIATFAEFHLPKIFDTKHLKKPPWKRKLRRCNLVEGAQLSRFCLLQKVSTFKVLTKETCV